VTLDNGSKQKLIRVFNPWNSEHWSNNPWADGSRKWTSKVKSQVRQDTGNDGVFWLSANDYLTNFGYTNWCEVR